MEQHVPSEVLAAFAEGELAPHEQRRVRRHTSRCEFCRTRAALRLGRMPEEVEGHRPFLLQLVWDWLHLRRLMAGLVALTLLAGASAPLIYMVLQPRQDRGVSRSDWLLRSSKAAPAPADPVASRRMSGKTFYLIHGVWVDSEVRPGERRPVMPCRQSDADCRHLIERMPQLAPYFGLGSQVIVVVEGRVFWLIKD